MDRLGGGKGEMNAQSDIHSCINTYVHTCVHAYIHIYVAYICLDLWLSVPNLHHFCYSALFFALWSLRLVVLVFHPWFYGLQRHLQGPF